MEGFNADILKGFHSSMEGLCLELLHQGYEVMLAAKSYDVDWEEDTLTIHYIDYMEKLPLCREQKIDIISQKYLYSEKHISGKKEAKYAPRIDFRFMTWFKDVKIEYFAEAKNLSEKSWKKKDGKGVNASYYYDRYVDTGISHLLTNYYPSNCVLIAYVLNGNKNDVLLNLNKLISLKFTDYGTIVKPDNAVNEEYYISENIIEGSHIVLKHLFLQLF